VVQRSPFGLRLYRLLTTRRPTAPSQINSLLGDLAERAGVPLPDLTAVVESAEPSAEFLRRLAPALGIHTADLFVIAGLAVPIDLASAWPTRPWDVSDLLRESVGLDTEQLGRINELVRSLPVSPRTEPPPVDDYPEWPGALLVRLARNRNIRRTHLNDALVRVGGGPFKAASSVLKLARGMVPITPEYVTGFAHLLGFPPREMVALTGVGPVIESWPAPPAHAELAALAWDARHLTSDQVRDVVAAARAS
jgi:hypothetical protein